MGATIAGQLLDPGLYMQSRATLVNSELGGEYFRREEGHISTFEAHAKLGVGAVDFTTSDPARRDTTVNGGGDHFGGERQNR